MPVDGHEHLHSRVALGLRMAVLESEYLFTATLSHMQAWGALHSHPQADIKAASEALKGLYGNAMACIPYMTGGKSGEEIMHSDRAQAIEEYNRLKSKLGPKKEAVQTVKDAPRAASKHKR